jgi:pimeloyl-ACP methyl ester carboxylesterase
MSLPVIQWATTPILDIAYYEWSANGRPVVILLHGFPDDPWAWKEVAETLSKAGCRVIAPYLRGFGPTRFLDQKTMRSGQQAALGHDVRDLMDTLQVTEAILVGYDWGSRAACVAAALWPERVQALAPIAGYTIQNIPLADRPAPPRVEYRFWYQWYFQTERGRLGLGAYRLELCELLWRLWSPNWRFTRETFDEAARSFDNPDFVDVVIHSYRHRCGAARGLPELEPAEARLAAQPTISAPTLVLTGEADPLRPPALLRDDSCHFTGYYEQSIVPSAGHFLPREAPGAVSAAVLKLIERV